ncbi:metallophosphoesterase family protein [Spirosoma validum]|uniref:Metallophosphoesterase family protein n=1 Tax=Spirosoma validum TaxID=2771355 RepID=A0A927B513_9BACT|nr:metallophosphoesterase family protein [Spirosoma validum]MBD2755780.1 metallophosphoesterase family protein [Spirosoma validum]
MIRIAVFSDVHANLPALRAVLTDLETRGINQYYCLGDLVDFAPWGNEVIELFRDKKIPCLLGNHDERIAFDSPITPLPHHDKIETENRMLAIDYSKRVITYDNKQWLAQLPFQIELVFKLGESLKRILLVHASPRHNDEYIHESYPTDALLAMLGDKKPDALLMGHTHQSYSKHSDVLLVNCGSVGRSKETDRKATYCLLTISEAGILPEIVKVDYDLDYVAAAIYNSPIPDFYGDFLLQKWAVTL